MHTTSFFYLFLYNFTIHSYITKITFQIAIVLHLKILKIEKPQAQCPGLYDQNHLTNNYFNP